MADYVIIHGELVEVTDDALMHWKYIKREKLPDGSYKYYYDDTTLNSYKYSVKDVQKQKNIMI